MMIDKKITILDFILYGVHENVYSLSHPNKYRQYNMIHIAETDNIR